MPVEAQSRLAFSGEGRQALAERRVEAASGEIRSLGTGKTEGEAQHRVQATWRDAAYLWWGAAWPRTRFGQRLEDRMLLKLAGLAANKAEDTRRLGKLRAAC
ncbi:hypothetical protein Q669_29285 [Labrenzia sp. C1B10]|nr:hypothetical protein Q669_29285 [Labrenzia sp. C1B10]ERS05735.1 hypothetical protein Q675_28850 [Labrenzia sp. C1B70]